MIQKMKRTAAFVSAVLICAASAAPMSASAAYGAGGNGKAVMEYLDRGIYAVKSGRDFFQPEPVHMGYRISKLRHKPPILTT
ncbi:MAG: hypothetical protein MJ071_07830 [Oscillospiraceae bacterium]|nr:hypothetical protein [Oscillospiraceae bacterium]